MSDPPPPPVIRVVLSVKRKIFKEYFSLAVASSCSHEDKIVEPYLLNKDAISRLGKRDAK